MIAQQSVKIDCKPMTNEVTITKLSKKKTVLFDVYEQKQIKKELIADVMVINGGPPKTKNVTNKLLIDSILKNVFDFLSFPSCSNCLILYFTINSILYNAEWLDTRTLHCFSSDNISIKNCLILSSFCEIMTSSVESSYGYIKHPPPYKTSR